MAMAGEHNTGLNATVILVWRGVLISLIAAGILAGWQGAQQLARTASILERVEHRLNRQDERIRYLERNMTVKPTRKVNRGLEI